MTIAAVISAADPLCGELAEPMPTQIIRRAPPSRMSPVAKICIALGLFIVADGGWKLWQWHRSDPDAAAPLPNVDGPQGPCVLWFVGSSSIFKWTTLERDMEPWIARNRGISGATIAYVNLRFSNEDVAHRPQAVIFYGGENDIAYGEAPSDALADLNGFLVLKSRKLGRVPVFIVSVKPSPERLEQLPKQTTFNAAARSLAGRRRDLTYIDIASKMLVDGKPGPFYVPDGIHMNAAGYRLWTEAVRKSLHDMLPRRVRRRCGQGSLR